MHAKKSPGAALVTGAARRIGHSIALALAARGYDIALHYNRSEKEAVKTAAMVRRKNTRCEIFHCDLAGGKDISLMMDEITEKFSNLNLIINNASVFLPSRLDFRGMQLFDLHMAVNLHAPYIITAKFAQLHRKGHIINLLDAGIVRNKTKYLAYLLSKKALAEFTKMSAAVLGPHIRVNGVAPDLILPPENKNIHYLERRSRAIPLRRRGCAENILQSINFLLDDNYITGQILFIDGGESLL